jgi:hypothetical protein
VIPEIKTPLRRANVAIETHFIHLSSKRKIDILSKVRNVEELKREEDIVGMV